MGEPLEIKKLEDVLSLILDSGEKITSKTVSALTAPGENYGSVMLRIDVNVKNENNGKERTLNTVGKLIPKSEHAQKVFNIQQTYRNEYTLYAEIVPIFDEFLKNKGISSGADFIAQFFGGRLNLDGSEKVNLDAIILMENLKLAGYTTGQKSEGFDLETSKVILDSLAKFHAAGIALKHQKPETFEKKIMPYFYCFIPEDHLYDMVLNKVIEKLGQNGFSLEEIDAVAKYKNKNLQKIKYTNEIWGTIIHYDSWTNNFLIKYENSEPVHAVIVDFQVFDYKSPLDDVMFFIFSSVQQDIFEEGVDPLLEHYYGKFLDYLKKFGVNIQLFSKSKFEEEIKFAVRNYEYAHCLWMLFPIMDDAFKSVDDSLHSPADWSEKHVRRIVQLTKICFKKGWLSVK